MERQVVVCSPGGRPESPCGCYACRLRRLMDAVAAMRHAQQEYFRTRSPSALETAKRAERRVDQLMAEMSGPPLF